ncbi:MAG: hypothetical protein KJ065_12720 [Anaerolineae bacterium]|nr:hypothetical protein [Anaerolineae bacterium]
MRETDNYSQHDDAEAIKQSRRLLYQLLFQLRVNARYTDSEESRALFRTSAEVVAGLARMFRKHNSH